jgi:hypothetical protein
MRRFVVVALLLAVGAARAEKQLDGGQVHQGFALELSLSSEVVEVAGIGSTASFSGLQGGLFAGYKISRVIVGMGIDLARQSGAAGGGTFTSILFSPGVRVAFVRSAENRVEMFGLFDLGFGTTLVEGNDAHPFNLRYRTGPGVRYWPHPQFAVSAAAGVEGTFFGLQEQGSTAITSIFATLQLMGVF